MILFRKIYSFSFSFYNHFTVQSQVSKKLSFSIDQFRGGLKLSAVSVEFESKADLFCAFMVCISNIVQDISSSVSSSNLPVNDSQTCESLQPQILLELIYSQYSDGVASNSGTLDQNRCLWQWNPVSFLMRSCSAISRRLERSFQSTDAVFLSNSRHRKRRKILLNDYFNTMWLSSFTITQVKLWRSSVNP